MPPRRRGARTGRGWDAAPSRRAPDSDSGATGRPRRRFGDAPPPDDEFAPSADEAGWPPGVTDARAALRPASALPTPARPATAEPSTPDDPDAYTGRILPWSDRPLTDPGDAADRPPARDDEPADGDPPRRRGTRGRGANTGGPGAGDQARQRRGPRTGADQPQNQGELAREICIRQLAVRPRTRAELAKALTKREIAPEVIAEVLDRYDEVGLIDDAAFARAWVTSRHHGKGLARRALANELRQRGVDAEIASEALETVDDDAEATAARALVDRKLRSARGTPEQVFRRLVGMLARKGYPAGVAISAVKDALAARDEEAAEFADNLDAEALTAAETTPD
ncbi:hypothetical protein Sya03_09460 [Spirilliplanes yamanashiensis]|uniref:Regulatory protein RecX n=1 Tax=Spirilliplanes yamanashiensis TaxID=42233 RepID=A0A8J3Y504_9ACTN|nr:regulatory protein [Spirilliplanes yamanashiensis]GIJ01594.1 hypothetical protein Sya03_09460 [Spirilliplanes yamanashiensis]